MSAAEGCSAFRGSHGGCDRGDIGDFVSDRGFADVRIVVYAESPDWRIDHQLNLSILDSIDNVRPALMHLENEFGFQTVLVQETVGSVGGLDLEAQFFSPTFLVLYRPGSLSSRTRTPAR